MEYTLDELIIWLRANAAADIRECALEDRQETVSAWMKDAARHNAIADALERLKAVEAEEAPGEPTAGAARAHAGVVLTDAMKRRSVAGRPSIYERLAMLRGRR